MTSRDFGSFLIPHHRLFLLLRLIYYRHKIIDPFTSPVSFVDVPKQLQTREGKDVRIKINGLNARIWTPAKNSCAWFIMFLLVICCSMPDAQYGIRLTEQGILSTTKNIWSKIFVDSKNKWKICIGKNQRFFELENLIPELQLGTHPENPKTLPKLRLFQFYDMICSSPFKSQNGFCLVVKYTHWHVSTAVCELKTSSSS